MLLTKNYFAKAFSRNVHSQNGEDGILEEICRRLQLTPEWACEFGAWDGRHLSNTFQFVERVRTKAVYIEGDPAKYKDLLETVKCHPSIQPLLSMVAAVDSPTGSAKSLDTLLGTTSIPADFDILSIDVDGEDYHLWESLAHYRPKIVVIEINSLVHPSNTTHIHSAVKGYSGSGFGATLALGERKGYRFVCHTGNMIFVRADLFEALGVTYDDPIDNFETRWINGGC